MKALALTGVGIGLCGIAALASPLVTLALAGGRSRPATTTGPRRDDLVAASGHRAAPHRPGSAARHDTAALPDTPALPGTATRPDTDGMTNLLPFIPAQRTRL